LLAFFGVGQSGLNVGLGLHHSVSRHELIGVEPHNSFGGRDPAFRDAALFEMDQWIGKLGGDDVASKYDLFAWQIDSPLG
jgi:hypothetical protein